MFDMTWLQVAGSKIKMVVTMRLVDRLPDNAPLDEALSDRSKDKLDSAGVIGIPSRKAILPSHVVLSALSLDISVRDIYGLLALMQMCIPKAAASKLKPT